MTENHLAPDKFAELLNEIANAIRSGIDWWVAFRDAYARFTLNGDVVGLEVRFLDRAMRRSILADGYDVPSFAVGSSYRYYGVDIPPELRRLTLARVGRPVFCSFVGGLSGLDLTDMPPFVSSPRSPITGRQWYEGMAARQVCELLGLGHRPKVDLVMLTYRRPERLQLRRPTAVDADGDEHFVSSRSGDPCGVTRNLRTGMRSMPEAVHENLEVDGLLEILYDLGPV